MTARTTKRRTREKEQRREAILRAAERVFHQRGFAQTTMDHVAAAAELSKGTLYLYFKNKDDLFVALSTCMVDEFLARFQEVLDAGGPGIEQVRAMLTAYGEVVAANPDHFRTTVIWMASGHAADTSTAEFKAHRARANQLVAAMIVAIERGQKDGSIRSDLDPAQTAFRMWAGVLGCMQIQINRREMSRRFPEPVDFDEFLPGFLAILCDGLRPRSIKRQRGTR
jgi:AcrR family transcriptional regulator